jgi:alanine dehydrogenase
MDARVKSSETLLLSRTDVERLLSPEVCIAAVEDAFRQYAEGAVPPPGILGMHAAEGSFHVKAGFLTTDRPYFAAKLNANFPRNGQRHALPTIQGAVILCDAACGTPLAIMDSIAITALRTAAASAVAIEEQAGNAFVLAAAKP